MTTQKYIGPFRIGEVINGQYKIVRLLGMGGHAHVYECYDDLLDATVAVKVISNPLGRGRELVKRAKAEAQVMFRLRHANVVQVNTAFTVDEMICIVMEKLEGITLRMMLALLGRLTIVEALQIARQVAIGVGAAHEVNVVHRDIKPDNVFVLPPNNAVKVLDFGIAKFMGHGPQTTDKDRLHGTPLYMSPEHLRLGKVTPRSDIYQLGTVLFELIAGVNPCLIDRENHDIQQIGFLQISRVAPPLSSLVRGVPVGLDWLVQCAIAKDPNQRFASMEDMVHAIDRAIEERLGSHPQEGKNVRYLDETMMRAAKELAARADPDELLGRMPPKDEEAAYDDPIELAANEAVAMTPVTLERRLTPVGKAIEAMVAPGSQVRPGLAPTAELGPMQHAVQAAATPFVSVSQPMPPQPTHRRRPLSVAFLVTPVFLGAVVGVVVSIRWYEYDRQALAAQATEADAPSSQLPQEGSPPEPSVAAAHPSAALLDTPPSPEQPAAPPTRPTVASAVAPISVVAKPAAKQRRSLYATNEPLFKSQPSPKATKEDLARARARMREFNEDIERELNGSAQVKQ